MLLKLVVKGKREVVERGQRLEHLDLLVNVYDHSLGLSPSRT